MSLYVEVKCSPTTLTERELVERIFESVRREAGVKPEVAWYGQTGTVKKSSDGTRQVDSPVITMNFYHHVDGPEIRPLKIVDAEPQDAEPEKAES